MNMNKKDADQKKAFIEGHLLGVLYARPREDQTSKKEVKMSLNLFQKSDKNAK